MSEQKKPEDEKPAEPSTEEKSDKEVVYGGDEDKDEDTAADQSAAKG